MSEFHPSVIYRDGPITAADYEEAIRLLTDAVSQPEPNGNSCHVCGDSGHQAWECHHNPLVMARRAAADACKFRCFHCGEIFTTDESAREHFGEKQDALPACLTNSAKLIALMKAAVELAIIRSNLNSDEGHTLGEPVDLEAIATDAANAVRGIDTCECRPAPEWLVFFQGGS